MKALWHIAVLTILLPVGTPSVAQPPAGSHLPLDKNSCATCHGEKDLWDANNLRLFVPGDQLAEDIHWMNGVNCSDCHGGDPGSLNFQQAHAAQVDGASTTTLPFKPLLSQEIRSPARLETLVQVCGKCHPHAATDYMVSVHGHGFQESGLIVTAVCTDCHGSHGIYPASHPQSTLRSAIVSATCAKCHRFIQDRLQQSVHGLAPTIEQTRQSAEEHRNPVCTDCHQGHDLPHPKSSEFRLGLSDRCGSCHADLANSYSRSLHGQLTDLGYVPAAKCSDCHGSHDILPVSDPASKLSTINRRATCAKCHRDANESFLNFDPHANSGDAERDAILNWVDWALTGLLISVFAVFGTHSLLWFVRSLPYVAKRGRPKYPMPGAYAFVRFEPIHRVAHAVLVVSFLGLALTGLPLKYSEHKWAQAVSWALGGFASTGLWHRIFGIANIGCLAFYVMWFAGQVITGPTSGVGRFRFVFGPDSPVLNRRDPSDLARNLRWFVGRGPKPKFERWTYWEKFDLWAAAADIVLIGGTGLILWFPNQFCELLPGQSLNIAHLVHGKLALLATGFVFAIHFFNANLRPERFPMDISILTGLVSEQELAEERPEYVERLRRTGQLHRRLAITPSRRTLALFMLGGFVALSIGLALLVAIIVATL